MSYLNQTIKNVYVCSKQRLIGESSNSITVRFNPSIDKCRSVQVVTCEIPQTWYPFTNYNNKMAYTIENDDTGTVYYANLPTSKYYFNMSDLATDLTTALNNAVDAENNAVSYTFAVSFTESKMSFLYSKGTDETNGFAFMPVANSAYSMVGLSAYAESGFVDSYQCTSVANLQRTLAVYISCSIVPPNVYSTFPNGERVVAKIPVTVDAGSIVTYEDTSNSFTPLDSSYISQMSLTLIDDNGIPLDLNGADWSIELSFSY
jgi:hypothetical protein